MIQFHFQTKFKMEWFSSKFYLFLLILIGTGKGENAWQRLDKHEVNCSFNEDDQPFCEWKPASVDSADLWRTGNAIIVDSVNSITKAADGGS